MSHIRAEEPGSQFSVSSRFWLYWSVALPLTAMVIIGWQVWLIIYRKRQTRRVQDIEDAAGAGDPDTPNNTTQETMGIDETLISVGQSNLSLPSTDGFNGGERPWSCSSRTAISERSGSIASVLSSATHTRTGRVSPTSLLSQLSVSPQAS